jgi:hypothetical protein
MAAAGAALAVVGYAFAQDGNGASACRHPLADGGASVPFDPGAMAESYARFKDAFGRKLEVSLAKAKRVLDEPIDIGLPSCRFSSVKSQKLSFVIPAEFRRKTFLFVSADDGAEADRLAELHKEAIVFVTKARRLGDVGDIASRPVAIATPELAKSLGITCAPAHVSINSQGDRVELREGR